MIEPVVFKVFMHTGFICDIVTEHPDFVKYNEYDVREKDVYSKMCDITYALNNTECRACLFEVA